MEMKYPGGGIVNTEDTETLTASDSNGEYKKISGFRCGKANGSGDGSCREKEPDFCAAQLSGAISKELELTEDDPSHN